MSIEQNRGKTVPSEVTAEQRERIDKQQYRNSGTDRLIDTIKAIAMAPVMVKRAETHCGYLLRQLMKHGDDLFFADVGGGTYHCEGFYYSVTARIDGKRYILSIEPDRGE